MLKILVVEDDMTIAGLICEGLRGWGYETKYVTDFRNVTEQVLHNDPQLVLLDILLPYFNGFHWCAEIRKVSKIPIMFLSSASDNMSIVMAMNMGGDDFVEKPFDMNVLVAKVGALLRRTYSFGGQVSIIERGGAVLNLGAASLTIGERRLELTKNEFKILQLLMENAGHTVSRDTIMERLWESESFIDDNTLTVNVTRLRRKLEEAGAPDFIRTKKGLGYRVD